MSDKSQIKILEEFKKDGEKWYRCECLEHGIFEKRKFDFEKSKYGCQKLFDYGNYVFIKGLINE